MAPGRTDALLTHLSDAEQVRFGRHRHVLSANQFLIGRVMVRRWLHAVTGTPASAWRLVEGQRGRPEIAHPPSPWAFNLAHSGSLVACVLSKTADVGIDLEDLDRRPLTRDLARRFCSPLEAADIEAHPVAAQARRFLTYWTLKEAYLKARGLGIAVHLADLEFTLSGSHPTINFRASLADTSRDWAFEIFHPTPRYLLSVAAPQPEGSRRPAMELHALSLDWLTEER
jgi:4'-phosphopantetheinyl transferase